MARVAFFNIPFHGHANPTLPLVREAVERVASEPGFRDRLASGGEPV